MARKDFRVIGFLPIGSDGVDIVSIALRVTALFWAMPLLYCARPCLCSTEPRSADAMPCWNEPSYALTSLDLATPPPHIAITFHREASLLITLPKLGLTLPIQSRVVPRTAPTPLCRAGRCYHSAGLGPTLRRLRRTAHHVATPSPSVAKPLLRSAATCHTRRYCTTPLHSVTSPLHDCTRPGQCPTRLCLNSTLHRDTLPQLYATTPRPACT